MPTDASQAGFEQLRSSALDLAWSLWAELGVSSWHRRHTDWSVELEPLIIFTALVAQHDPRLLREAVDWCVKNDRFISLVQLRNIVIAQRLPFEGEIARFGGNCCSAHRTEVARCHRGVSLPTVAEWEVSGSRSRTSFAHAIAPPRALRYKCAGRDNSSDVGPTDCVVSQTYSRPRCLHKASCRIGA